MAKKPMAAGPISIPSLNALERADYSVRPGDPRLARSRIVSVPLANIAMLLTMDGSYGVKMSGWPEGAIIIGAKLILRTPTPRLDLLLHHPDFPLNLTGSPEQIMIRATRVE